MRKKGAALIVTLWVLVLLGVVAMSFSLSARRGSASTRNFKEDTLLHYRAVSAYEEALAYILTDRDPEVDFIDEDGNFRTDEERPPITGITETDGVRVELRITDEESRLDINRISINDLQQILESTGVPYTAIQELLDSLADWKDPDDLHHHLGAEDEYYKPLGYTAKDRPLEIPEELLLIKGFSPEYFFGGDSTSSLEPILTTWGQGININTISPELMDALGMDPSDIDLVISKRGAQTAVRTVPTQLTDMGGTIKSFNFRIQVKAGLEESPRSLRITSILRRTMVPEGPELRTLYWKEDFENSGT